MVRMQTDKVDWLLRDRENEHVVSVSPKISIDEANNRIISAVNGMSDSASDAINSTIEIKSWILSFGINAEVLEPAALRNEFAHELAQILRKYQATPEDLLFVAKKTKRAAK